MSGLRQELLGLAPLPSLRMLLPAGWRAVPLDEGGREALNQQLSETFMRAGRPDLDAEVTGAIEKWGAQLHAQGGRFAVLPLDLPEGVVLPLSMTVSLVSEIGGMRLDDWVSRKIRQGDTEFLDEHRTVLAWYSRATQAENITTEAYTYLIPVPGTHREQAVLLSGIQLVLTGSDEEQSEREAAKMLFDSIALAVDWMAGAR